MSSLIKAHLAAHFISSFIETVRCLDCFSKQSNQTAENGQTSAASRANGMNGTDLPKIHKTPQLRPSTHTLTHTQRDFGALRSGT